jgi:hypothetical protein
MSKNPIKRMLLERKIKEYFAKHPKSQRVVIKTDLGEGKTIWKVTKLAERI